MYFDDAGVVVAGFEGRWADYPIRWAEIDREPRKGKLPSDHAPLLVDLDEPRHPFAAGWEAAAARRVAREAGKGK